MLKKIFAISLTVALLSPLAFSALAQDDPGVTLLEDETVISLENLDIETPTLLPDSKFYFLKEWSRGIRSFFTFNKVKKAALELKFSSEKLIETQLLALRNKGANAIEKAVQKYQQSMEKVEKAIGKIKGNASTSDSDSNTEANKFMEKFENQRELHIGILDKLVDQVPTSTMARIRETRELHLEKFEGVMLKLEEKFQLRSQQKINKSNTTGADEEVNNEEEEEGNNGNGNGNGNATITDATNTGQKQQGQTKWIRLDEIEVVGEPVE